MENNIFKFKQFSIKQENKVFKIGTDGVLLGILANTEEASTILDVGSGTGLLALISAQKNEKALITSIDNSKESYLLSKKNFKNSSFHKRLNAIYIDFNDFSPLSNFDYIISNPPYFKNNYPHTKYPFARQQITLTFKEFLIKSSKLINENAKIGIIIPYETATEVTSLANHLLLYPCRKIAIRGIKNGKIQRIILEFTKNKLPLITQELCIEETPRKWTEDYIELISDYFIK